jgi:hypothetical protein
VSRRGDAVFVEASIRANEAKQAARIADAAGEHARCAFGLPPWKPLFNGSAKCILVLVEAVGDLNTGDASSLVIAVCHTADSEQEIPTNVRGAVLGKSIPHLSFFDVRARQDGVVLCVR